MTTLPSLLALIGPSGSGKSTLAQALSARGLVTLVPTWTTQPDEPAGIARMITSAERLVEWTAATGLAPVVYQVCAPIQQAAARLAERGLDPVEREQRLAGFHAERVAGARLSDRTFLNTGQLTELIAAVSIALAADFETRRRPCPTTHTVPCIFL